MLYPFYGSYTKIFTIFEPAHDLIHKIKHNSKTAEKEKENATVPLRPRNSAQAHAKTWPSRPPPARADGLAEKPSAFFETNPQTSQLFT